MTLFNRYIAVDWSANDKPKGGKDSIWVAERDVVEFQLPAINIRTRQAAMEHVTRRLQDAVKDGRRTLIGFDFPFGYPIGATALLTGVGSWQALWGLLRSEIVDSERNKSNRFVVASKFNELLTGAGPRFWGCPPHAATRYLSTKKEGANFGKIPEFRRVELVARGAKSVWQLHYNGCVGSQCLLGLAWLERLRTDSELSRHIAVWPYETDFERAIDRPIVLAEIYPSRGLEIDETIAIKDRAQVEAQVRHFETLDRYGRLDRALSFPSDIEDGWRRTALAEEGWIVGVGHGDFPR